MAEDRSAVLYGVAMAPPLMLRIGVAYLRLKRRSRRAEKGFKRALLRNGVPDDIARQLTDEYTSYVSVRRWLREFGPGSILGRGRAGS
jgi:hypothetical protein